MALRWNNEQEGGSDRQINRGHVGKAWFHIRRLDKIEPRCSAEGSWPIVNIHWGHKSCCSITTCGPVGCLFVPLKNKADKRIHSWLHIIYICRGQTLKSGQADGGRAGQTSRCRGMFSTRWYCHPFILLLASCSSVVIRDASASKANITFV